MSRKQASSFFSPGHQSVHAILKIYYKAFVFFCFLDQTMESVWWPLVFEIPTNLATTSDDTVYHNFSKIVLSQPKKSLGMNWVLERCNMKTPGSLTNSVAVLLMLTAMKQIWIMKTAFIWLNFFSGHSKYTAIHLSGSQKSNFPWEAPRSLLFLYKKKLKNSSSSSNLCGHFRYGMESLMKEFPSLHYNSG